MNVPRRVVDAHVHLYDHQTNRHAFLERVDPGYEAFVGNYDQMPRLYLLPEYLADTSGFRVEGIVWHEFLSDDPWREVLWAQQLANAGGMRHALVALVDFLDPELDRKLEQYESLPNLTAVREHLVWDPSNPLKRFAKRPDLLVDPAWHGKIGILNNRRFKCGLEIFAHQLPALIDVIRKYPDIGFTIAVLGWPLDISTEGFSRWRRDLTDLAVCENICMDISALECIFGMRWSEAQALPWVHAAFETLGVSRCMFGSHLPVSKLSTDFKMLYERYAGFVRNCTDEERDALFFGVANAWFNPS